MHQVALIGEIKLDAVCSNVAKGAGEGGIALPINLRSMQNTPFLALLGPIFEVKTKIAPPHWYWR